MILDVSTDEIQVNTPWAMVCADDLVICDETRERTEDRLGNWRGCLEDAGLKVSRSKVKHLPPAGNLQKINMNKYDSDGKTTAVISIQIFGNYDRPRERMSNRSVKGGLGAWYGWRELTGVLCYKEIPTKLKVLLYKTAIKRTLMYG